MGNAFFDDSLVEFKEDWILLSSRLFLVFLKNGNDDGVSERSIFLFLVSILLWTYDVPAIGDRIVEDCINCEDRLDK